LSCAAGKRKHVQGTHYLRAAPAPFSSAPRAEEEAQYMRTLNGNRGVSFKRASVFAAHAGRDAQRTASSCPIAHAAHVAPPRTEDARAAATPKGLAAASRVRGVPSSRRCNSPWSGAKPPPQCRRPRSGPCLAPCPWPCARRRSAARARRRWSRTRVRSAAPQARPN